MGIDAIKASNINAMPQFKATNNAASTTKPETKENGNALLYGSIAALALLGTGYMIYRSRGKAKDFDKLKQQGFKFDKKLFKQLAGELFLSLRRQWFWTF